MSAYFESGFTVREPAWHGQGLVADRYPQDWDEARQWAGLTWEPISAPAFGFRGLRVDGGVTHDPSKAVTGDYERDDERQRIVRSDTGATLGVPTTKYQIITHQEMGEVIEAILDQPNVRYETAGAICDGKGVWALAYLDEPITLPGDNSVTLPYLALLNNHDGSGALRASSTSVRIVCANTFSAAEAEGDRNGTVFTFTHSKSWKDRIDEARQTITGVRREFRAYTEMAAELLNVRVNREQTEQFITAFIPTPPEGLASDRVLSNAEKARDAVRTILAGPTVETIGGSAFGLVQAAGEYLDHYRRYRSMDSYYRRQLLRPEPLKAKAVQLVREIVSA